MTCSTTRRSNSTVFPVFVTGLHCGRVTRADCRIRGTGLPGLRDRAPLRRAWASRSSRRRRGLPGLRDRAPLRPGSGWGGHALRRGLPGLRDRAPLRLHLHRGGHHSYGVFPVFVTGLHCGETACDRRERNNGVFPVFVTGLHCGELGHRGHHGGEEVLSLIHISEPTRRTPI